MKTNFEKGFTILEVLVAMAIVGMLIAAAAVGIGAVQRNSRDTRRKQAAQNLRVGYEDFYGNYGVRPTGVSGYTNNTFNITGANNRSVSVIVPEFGSYTAVSTTISDCFTTGVANLRENDRNNLYLCFDRATGQVGVRLESSSTGWEITAN